MERARKKQTYKKKDQGSVGESVSGLSQLEPGMPSLDNVEKVVDIVSPQGVNRKILETTETDPYDPPLAPPEKRVKGNT